MNEAYEASFLPLDSTCIVSFANNVDRVNCVSFIDKNGSTYKYSKATNTLAVITSDGYVITYYKPKDGYDYYKKQKKEKQRKR